MSAYATDGLKMSPYGNNWNIEFSKKRTELKTVRFFNISIDRAFALFTNNTFIADTQSNGVCAKNNHNQ